jgi:predicted metalloendopeptidase
MLDVSAWRRMSPCDDFYDYANRNWLQATAIPDDKPGWGTFALIDRRNKERLKAILASAAGANPYPAGSNRHKVVAYYASGMDEAAIAKAGLSPLAPLFAAIDAVKVPADLPGALATLHRAGIRAGFAFTVRQDAKDSRRYLAEIRQDGLGLPDRDYYFRDDERSTAQRNAYYATSGRSRFRRPARPHLRQRHLSGSSRAQMTLVERRDLRRPTTRAARASAAKRPASTGRPFAATARPGSTR